MVAQTGFSRVLGASQMVPGDVLAVKYPAGQNSSGHVMMVQAMGQWQARAASTQNFLKDNAEPNVAGYYEAVIDSSASFHGATDSRANKPGGIGRGGVFRIYADSSFQITGYTWSTVNGSEYKKLADGYSVAMGRYVAGW